MKTLANWVTMAILSITSERKKVMIDALLLHGYAHDNMFDIIKWQNNGGGSRNILHLNRTKQD